MFPSKSYAGSGVCPVVVLLGQGLVRLVINNESTFRKCILSLNVNLGTRKSRQITSVLDVFEVFLRNVELFEILFNKQGLKRMLSGRLQLLSLFKSVFDLFFVILYFS